MKYNSLLTFPKYSVVGLGVYPATLCGTATCGCSSLRGSLDRSNLMRAFPLTAASGIGLADEEALKKGLEEKAKEFAEAGNEIYVNE